MQESFLKSLERIIGQLNNIGFAFTAIVVSIGIYAIVAITVRYALKDDSLKNVLKYMFKSYFATVSKLFEEKTFRIFLPVILIVIFFSLIFTFSSEGYNPWASIAVSLLSLFLGLVVLTFLPSVVILSINYFIQDFFKRDAFKKLEYNFVWLPVICIFFTKALFFFKMDIGEGNLIRIMMGVARLGLVVFNFCVIFTNYLLIYKNVEKYIIHPNPNRIEKIDNMRQFKIFMVISCLIILLFNTINMLYWGFAIDQN
ncbi:hypothetical protein [Geosporobacter ferrireducens]|uniref:hypothetical protein n=1 Tax=Geosporobacter ferrireducens TaxID=1424294 RepID=UPI00139DE54E|nr:hypothetical protein [Geosporobacter ferrireducens]MTI56175.1 hypothetical protein [Geosporobacter ferrireducens]